MKNPTSTEPKSPELQASNVLNRQKGYNTVHDRTYYETHYPPFDWGRNEYEHVIPGGITKTSVWASKGVGNEYWAADFESG